MRVSVTAAGTLLALLCLTVAVPMARAANALGQTQTASLILNPAGYHHNVMHAVTLVAA